MTPPTHHRLPWHRRRWTPTLVMLAVMVAVITAALIAS